MPTGSDTNLLVVLMTAPNGEVAASLGRTLVEERLAACVNIVPGVRSIYRWDGAVQDDTEVLCLFKTQAHRFPALRDRIVALHPYAVPEVVALRAADVSAAYLTWVQQSTAPEPPANL